jgi:hypothetical protein
MQGKRVTLPASLGTTASTSKTTVNVTWPVTFGNLNYTIATAIQAPAGSNVRVVVTGQTATGCTLEVVNQGTTAVTPTIHVLAVAD